MAKDYSKFSHEELVKFIEELQSQLKSEKYGLYWDRSIETEECITKCAVYMPLLERIDEKTLFFDKSDNNILLEGDNYHSLATLKMLSNGKPICDAIYIDPPYNTGNEDFAYNDNYVDNDDGYRHSKWLSFMESRLKIAREILAEDGCIFISIDDHEMANLKLLCDQIFGAKNFINCIAIKMSEMSGVKMAHINLRLPKLKEYCLVYSKSNLFEIKPIVKNRIENLEEFSKYAKYYSKIIEDRSLPIEQWNIIPLTEYISKNNIPIKTDDEILRFKIENAERMVYRTNNKSFSKIRCDKDITKIISPTGIEYIWWEGKQMLFLSDYTKSYEGDFWTDISTINLNKEGGVEFYFDIQDENDIVVSGCPYCLLKIICERIGIKYYIGSDIDPIKGEINRICYKDKKIDAFREVYGDVIIDDFYTDSMNDTPMIEISRNAYLVKGDKIVKIK